MTGESSRPAYNPPAGWRCVSNSQSGTPVFQKRFSLLRLNAPIDVFVRVAKAWGGGWQYHHTMNDFSQRRYKHVARKLSSLQNFEEPEAAMLACELAVADLT